MTPYENKTLKDRFHEETAKLKEMSLKDKFWYICEYYKIPILGFLLAVIMIGSIGSAMYKNRFDPALTCLVLNARYDTETAPAKVKQYFDVDFRSTTDIEPQYPIDIDHTLNISFDSSTMSEFSYAELAKVTAMISSKQVDVMIGDPDTLAHYAAMGGFLDMEASLPDDLKDKAKDKLYTAVNEETGEEYVCGVYIGDTSFEEGTGLSVENPVMAIMNNSTHIDTSLQLLRYILE